MPQQYVFDCPACDTVVDVGREIRAEILDNGCVMCGARASDEDFRRAGTASQE